MSEQPGGAEQVLQRLTERSKEMRERAEAMQAELAGVLEQVTSTDRAVTVSVGAGGVMRGITIEPGGRRSTPQQIATSVMSAYGEGCRRVGEKAAQITERYAPGSPAVAMMRDAVPPAAPEFEDQR